MVNTSAWPTLLLLAALQLAATRAEIIVDNITIEAESAEAKTSCPRLSAQSRSLFLALALDPTCASTSAIDSTCYNQHCRVCWTTRTELNKNFACCESLGPKATTAPAVVVVPTAPPVATSEAPSVAPPFNPADIEDPSPSPVPVAFPTDTPADVPTTVPTAAPTDDPSPSPVPAAFPTDTPADVPTTVPTAAPTGDPSPSPVPAAFPTDTPADVPTTVPTAAPTDDPSPSPPVATGFAPTDPPTERPTATEAPTEGPTEAPMDPPTSSPWVPTETPRAPTETPWVPTEAPLGPTAAPWAGETEAPVTTLPTPTEPTATAPWTPWTPSEPTYPPTDNGASDAPSTPTTPLTTTPPTIAPSPKPTGDWIDSSSDFSQDGSGDDSSGAYDGPVVNTCADKLSEGDRGGGVRVITDANCINGGLGCFDFVCRFCKIRESDVASNFFKCAGFGYHFDGDEFDGDVTTSPPTPTTTAVPFHGDGSNSGLSDCFAKLSIGDHEAGIRTIPDAKCLFGGLGCFDMECRFCKIVETDKSKHLFQCGHFGFHFVGDEFTSGSGSIDGTPVPLPTDKPTEEPSGDPTDGPTTEEPTSGPMDEPTDEPTSEPTDGPTNEPTDEPTGEPTNEPTDEPTGEPTNEPTDEPTGEPTDEPTNEPTDEPTDKPTSEPADEPTDEPTDKPTVEPNGEPTGEPTDKPTGEPPGEPTDEPTREPTGEPTDEPTGEPTDEPTNEPTSEPMDQPTDDPTDEPTAPPAPAPTEPEPLATPAPEPTCDSRVSYGDAQVGIDMVTDAGCQYGGTGCFGDFCRLCKVRGTPESDHLLWCPDVLAAVAATKTEAPPKPADTSAPYATEAPASSPTVWPTVADACSSQVSSGDEGVGISAVTDSSCIGGGLGCFSDLCRFCKVEDTPQSRHLLPCTQFQPAIRPLFQAAAAVVGETSSNFAAFVKSKTYQWRAFAVAGLVGVVAVIAVAAFGVTRAVRRLLPSAVEEDSAIDQEEDQEADKEDAEEDVEAVVTQSSARATETPVVWSTDSAVLSTA